MLIILVALPLCIRYGPAWIVGDTSGLTTADRLKAENDARTALVQGFVGFLALGGASLGAVATLNQIRANRHGRATDLFIKAIELLADDRLPIRMGGVYALEQLAGDDADERFHGHAHALLTAFVRQRVPWPSDAVQGPVPGDVGAALAVLGRQSVILKGATSELESVDLRGVDLAGQTIPNVCFAHANLEGANLAEAEFAGATMSGTNLRNANLRAADLTQVDLTGADLAGADLTGAKLTGAKLENATLTDVKTDDTTRWPEGFRN